MNLSYLLNSTLKGCWAMKQVIQEVKRIDVGKRIPALKLEIDYELMTLHDAMIQEDIDQMNEAKRILELLREELVQLKGHTH